MQNISLKNYKSIISAKKKDKTFLAYEKKIQYITKNSSALTRILINFTESFFHSRLSLPVFDFANASKTVRLKPSLAREKQQTKKEK
jgi:hypothetical protein